MNKRPSFTIMTRLCLGVFFVVLLFLAFQLMPRALGQREAANKPAEKQGRAQAGRPHLSTAKQNSKPGRSLSSMVGRGAGHHRVMASDVRAVLPLAIYQLDDGTMENSVGFGNGLQNFESLWFNQFDVVAGQTMISTVSVELGNASFPRPVDKWGADNDRHLERSKWRWESERRGLAGTGQRHDPECGHRHIRRLHLESGGSHVSAFTSFFVGDMTPMNNGPEVFEQGLDQNPRPASAELGGGEERLAVPVDFNNPGNNDFIGLIDDFGLPGNWGDPADTGTPTPTQRRRRHRRARRSW